MGILQLEGVDHDPEHRDAPLGHTVDFERTLDPCIFMATITPDSPSPQANPETVESINPIFNDPEADVVLRSRDSRTFRVIKLYIIKTSTVLGDLIRAASDSETSNGNVARNDERLPEVQLCESGTILSSLLTFIFPVPPVLPSTLEETMELLSVSQKYEMDSVLIHVRSFLSQQDSPFIRPDNAFLAHSLAQRYRLRKEATQAARLTLKITLTIESLEPRFLQGDSLHELWKYHKAVRAQLLSDLSWPGVAATLKAPLLSSDCSQSTWIQTYIHSIIENPSLFDPIEFQMALARHTMGTDSEDWCSTCANIPVDAIRAFWTALSAAVHRCMERVSTVDVNHTSQIYSDTLTGRIRAANPSNGNELSKSRRFARHPLASARMPGHKRGGHHSTDIRPC